MHSVLAAALTADRSSSLEPDAASFSVVVYELRWACPYCRYCPLYTPDRKWACLFLLQVLPPSEHP